MPVYCFEVEVQSADGGGSMTGIWTVVAAADVVRTTTSTTTEYSSSQTFQRRPDNLPGIVHTGVSREEAIQIAKEFNEQHPAVVPTEETTTPPGAMTTTGPTEVTVRSAELVETNAPAVTNGREMLVWIVKLGGTHPMGEIRATIYIDATAGEVLQHLVY